MNPRVLLLLALAPLAACDDGSTPIDGPPIADMALPEADQSHGDPPDVESVDMQPGDMQPGDMQPGDMGLEPAPDMDPPDATPAELCERVPDDRFVGPDWGEGWSPESGELPPALVPAEGEFIVAVLPDTQIYAERNPAVFDSQLRWIAENAERYRIVFVSHVGDIVQNGNRLEQWAVARAAYDWIDDIGLPHGESIGSHDVVGGYDRPIDDSCSTRDVGRMDCEALDYKDNFGAQLYADAPWFGGVSPSGLSNYQRLEVEGLDLLFLHIVMDTPTAELEWAGEVLDAHPGALVHLTTHRYLFDYRLTEELPFPLSIAPAGRFTALTYGAGDQGLVHVDGVTAENLFDDFIAQHPNIWAVHCGHVDAEFHQISTNVAGLPVHEILVDFQDMDDGGGGWLRLLKFAPARDEVEVITYSTTSGEVRIDGAGFDHAIGILDDYRRAAQPYLESFGLDAETIEGLLAEVRSPGELRDRYYRSLYCSGQRDSRFVLDVDFDAYIEAGR